MSDSYPMFEWSPGLPILDDVLPSNDNISPIIDDVNNDNNVIDDVNYHVAIIDQRQSLEN